VDLLVVEAVTAFCDYMAYSEEDLEFNPFYLALQVNSRCRKVYSFELPLWFVFSADSLLQSVRAGPAELLAGVHPCSCLSKCFPGYQGSSR